MRGFLQRLAVAALLALCLQPGAWAAAPWKLLQSEHFELYSQDGEESARPVLAWFEQLRSFFLSQSGWKADPSEPVRLIAFASVEEFEAYRLHPLGEAYYAGMGTRNYIVMAMARPREFSMGAHEYAHLILHVTGLHLPPWLNEGLAEFFSTVRVSEQHTEIGGDLPARSQALRRYPWIPLPELLALTEGSGLRRDRSTAEAFYAEGWALTEMLLLSPSYSPRFQDLLVALGKDASSAEALTKVYARPLEAIATDLRAWVYRRNIAPIRLPGVATGAIAVKVSDVPPIAARLVLADALATAGELDRAEKLYGEVAREAPENAQASAALGTIAFRRGDSEGARRAWKRAIAQGIADASLCHDYAVLADQAGLPPEEIRPALERAIALKPDFDDARYQLALLEKNAGHHQAALAQFLAMRNVDPARAYAYWIALADTYNELGDRPEALAAARQAADRAATAEERQRAAQQALMAQTDLGVQFTRDASGRAQLTTTRVPHQAADWNPFIEAGDNLRRVEGALQQIDCSGDVMRIRVEASGGVLTLAIPDPTRVQMRNAPPEFVCGPQSGQPVRVEYAVSKDADDVLRGMEFH